MIITPIIKILLKKHYHPAIEAGNYDWKEFLEHQEKFKPVLNELTKENVNMHQVVYNIFSSDKNSTTTILPEKLIKCVKYENNEKESILEFLQIISDKFNNLDLDNRVDYGFYWKSLYEVQANKNKSEFLADFKRLGLENFQDLDVYSDILNSSISFFSYRDIGVLESLVSYCGISETLVCLVGYHKIVFVIGGVSFLPILGSIFNEGCFTKYLKDVVKGVKRNYKFNINHRFNRIYIDVHNFIIKDKYILKGGELLISANFIRSMLSSKGKIEGISDKVVSKYNLERVTIKSITSVSDYLNDHAFTFSRSCGRLMEAITDGFFSSKFESLNKLITTGLKFLSNK